MTKLLISDISGQKCIFLLKLHKRSWKRLIKTGSSLGCAVTTFCDFLRTLEQWEIQKIISGSSVDHQIQTALPGNGGPGVDMGDRFTGKPWWKG
jgi:hypothetical protein